LERGRERDVSEQIALGIPAKTAGASGEGLFDSRLFNQSRGLSSGNFFEKIKFLKDK
jgi:SNW domain-containing protein 1